MRELTKSIFSWSWAMSVFGVQQMIDLAGGLVGSQERAGEAARRFDNVAGAAAAEMGQSMRATLDAGNNMQRGAVDLMFNSLGMFDPRRWTNMAGCAPPASAPNGAARQNPFAQTRPANTRGCGAMPPA